MLKLDWEKTGWKHIKKCSDFSVQSQLAVYTFCTTVAISKKYTTRYVSENYRVHYFKKILHLKIIFRYLSKYINMNAIFKALNDETRREILELLRVQEMTAGDIADQFNISKPSISHHLDILKRADMVTSEKKGQFVVYSLNTTIVDDILKWIISLKK